MDEIKNMHDLLSAREPIEWSNMWYSCANCNSDERILLLGDSTARMVRSTFERETNRPVDLFGCSYGLHDVLFWTQLSSFFASVNYRYDTIFIQLGHHSRINDFGHDYTDEDYNIFGKDLLQLVDYLPRYGKKIVLCTIFYSVIPPQLTAKIKNESMKKFCTMLYNKLKRFEDYDEEVNSVKKRKNEVVLHLSHEKNIPCLDINSIMCNSKKKYVHIDHVHFENKAKKAIVNEYIRILSEIS